LEVFLADKKEGKGDLIGGLMFLILEEKEMYIIEKYVIHSLK
tara:strand:- start:5359 stop:5484 length:126 start_codon:yes stop_codon:yes gene_type:complete